MSTVNLATPHQATLSLTGLPPVTANYSHTGTWTTVDGWTASAGVSLSALSEGLQVDITGTSGTYIARTSAAGTYRRVRALVRLADPEARPVEVRVTNQSNDATTGTARLVSGVAVWVEGVVNDGATAVRIYATLPAGAASALVVVEEVVIVNVEPYDWWVRRTDANGVAYILAGPAFGPDLPFPGQAAQTYADPDASGNLTFVDQEASLVGSVSWFVEKAGWAGDETLTGTLAQTGYAVLHRVHAAGTLHQVVLIEFSGTYPGVATPTRVIGSDVPAMPTEPLGSREGTVILYFDTLDAAETVAADLRAGEVMMLRQPAAGRVAMDAYLVPTGLDVRAVLLELLEPKWALTATYVETARGEA